MTDEFKRLVRAASRVAVATNLQIMSGNDGIEIPINFELLNELSESVIPYIAEAGDGHQDKPDKPD